MTSSDHPESPPSDDLEAAFEAALARLRILGLAALPVEPGLAEPRSFLKILKARHMNWSAPGFRKIFGMRFSVRMPALEQMNVIAYPEPCFETPIFLFFCLLTSRKMIGHVNVNLTLDDAAYRERWVAPLLAVKQRLPSFDCDDRYPEWMLKWRTPAGIYGMFPRERFADFLRCGLGYLDAWLDLARRCAPETDAGRLAAIRGAHARFVSDIRTQDKAQGMMAKMIGAGKARRIFWEVTT
jgi:hypothetical protein